MAWPNNLDTGGAVDEMSSFKEELRGSWKILFAGVVYVLFGIVIAWLAVQCSGIFGVFEDEPPEISLEQE